MIKRRALVVFLLVLMLLVGVPAWGQSEAGTLTVFAAASLTDAFEEIGLAFEAAHPGVDVLFSFANSATLAAQIAEGAPADVFASANLAQMDAAAQSGRVADEVRTFARNRLVVVMPAGNPAGIESLHDLANSGLRLVLAAPGVPARDYAEMMLERMSADPDYGDGFGAAVLANLVSEEETVRAITAKVALGEADAAVVYASDVTPDLRDQVVTLAVPDAFNTIAEYPIAPINDSPAPELARRFIDYLLAADGQAVLEAWGFMPVAVSGLPEPVTLSPVAGEILVDGRVDTPLSLSLDDLRAFARHSLEVSMQREGETVTTAFTGALVWDVLNAAQPQFDASIPGDPLRLYLVVTGSDGYQAVVSWGEIDPAYTGTPVLLAYEVDGAAIDDAGGPVRLIVPSDRQAGRFVSGVSNISLRDAPAPTR